eukprot:3998556-Alexandrium_andersonii.AAC.1
MEALRTCQLAARGSPNTPRETGRDHRLCDHRFERTRSVHAACECSARAVWDSLVEFSDNQIRIHFLPTPLRV